MITNIDVSSVLRGDSFAIEKLSQIKGIANIGDYKKYKTQDHNFKTYKQRCLFTGFFSPPQSHYKNLLQHLLLLKSRRDSFVNLGVEDIIVNCTIFCDDNLGTEFSLQELTLLSEVGAALSLDVVIEKN